MPDREKVIRGLECIGGYRHMEANPCAECGYNECQTFSICIGEIARDALELLKEQESHLLTLDEADAAEVVWFEARNHSGWLRVAKRRIVEG